jgi:hypothetical protein
LNDHARQFLFGISLPILVKYIGRSIDSHMATWKVIEIVSGNIEAVSGTAAEHRPSQHEFLVWEGEAAHKAEALQSAEKADPRVDLEWMRIRYERDLNVR